MKLAMTLVVRNEDDILDAQLSFHLNVGVDVVLVTDHGSSDGTPEILDAYSREGVLHVTREEGRSFRQAEWVTAMARRAATEHGADWVINSDADEFWWPHGASLKGVLGAIPADFGQIRCLHRTFLAPRRPRAVFWEGMTIRLAPHAPINSPVSPFRPNVKVVHRGTASVRVSDGNHGITGDSLKPLQGWYPIEVLHFPFRGVSRFEQKLLTFREVLGRTAYGQAFDARSRGEFEAFYDSIGLTDADARRGLASGVLVEDTRLRDVLQVLRRSPSEGGASHRKFSLPRELERPLALTRPSIGDAASYAGEHSILESADVVRLQRRIDVAEGRVRAVESGSLRGSARRHA